MKTITKLVLGLAIGLLTITSCSKEESLPEPVVETVGLCDCEFVTEMKYDSSDVWVYTSYKYEYLCEDIWYWDGPFDNTHNGGTTGYYREGVVCK